MKYAKRPKKTMMITLTVVAALTMTSPLAAEEEKAGWRPPPPMPDDFDWIQLVSGEWLKGEIIAMYKKSLDFDSEELDDLTFDWEDIREIRSARTMQVAFLDDVIAVGKLYVDGEQIRVMGEKDHETQRSQVLSITAGEPKERNYWSGKVGVGINLRSGNTEQKETNGQANIVRRTPKDRIKFDYLGNFSESDGTSIADNQLVSTVWNRFLSDRFFISPVFGEYYRDPFKNIGSRWSLGVGAGYQLVDSSKVTWDVNAGIAYQRTTFDDVVEGEPESAETPAFIIGTRYDNEITGWMDYFFEFTFNVVNQESGSYTHHLITGFQFDLIGDLDFDISVLWDRIQDPRANSDGTVPEKDDFRTIFGLGYSF